MSHFLSQLKQLNPEGGQRRWLFVPYDQLSDQIGPLAENPPEEMGVVLVENRWKPRRRPYHQQKLALILANSRHFALEQARRGVKVKYLFGDAPYHQILKPHLEELGPLRVMEPAERELRVDLDHLDGLETIAHQGWLTTPEQFLKSQKGLKSWRMDSFYRHIRQQTGILMEQGKPLGGKYSHDAANRQSWPGEPEAPTPPTFAPDPIKEEVADLIEDLFSHHPGRVDLAHLPATFEDSHQLWNWAQKECMIHFGAYEDAMSWRCSGLFHTRLSPVINIHRLLPRQIIQEGLQLDIPLNSKEGFVRQILGWREFMRHVHRETDGFRHQADTEALPGSAGYDWGYSAVEPEPGGGATPNFLEAHEPLPPAFWGEVESGLACLDTVVKDVWQEAYSHHITRLMVLSNLATLLGYNPRQVTDWFWVAYCDAYDWVVEPNVLGMGLFSLGELFTTKPYVSGSAYINRMSDYCSQCQFDPKKDCPITPLYWAFLERHQKRLENNQRMGLILRNLKKRSDSQKNRDRETFERLQQTLARGDRLAAD